MIGDATNAAMHLTANEVARSGEGPAVTSAFPKTAVSFRVYSFQNKLAVCKRKVEPDKYLCGFSESHHCVNGFLDVENL